LEHLEDAQVARELVSGQPEAFDRFVDSHHSKLFQYAYLMCGNREDAEEVSQETLLNVFKTVDQLREPARFKAWVFRIAKNACLAKRRTATRALRFAQKSYRGLSSVRGILALARKNSRVVQAISARCDASLNCRANAQRSAASLR
jgi:RNA polymerase sigma factor (sigma-70 family)